ncbi:L-threo-3-deoxy-hexylosonate aldolase [Lachnellula suecica]|uniref:L-threo-3-deoxy-hexylosonate aldolase n=1 Tax=Lachnellula suecica TaxID=602035 RepID=A0A8T9CEM6_9HELO|nr:L-threo-3-deoxy-hexylosonate aldolase [Lachnellula suecica]
MTSPSPALVPEPGVYVPTVTFFKPSTSSSARQAPLEIATQCLHSVHLAKNGIRGLVLMGSTGEAIHLSRTERFELLSGVREGLTEAGFPDYPIIAGVLTNSVDEALEWLGDAKEAGAQWGLVLAPGYFGGVANQENLLEWYTLVADASPIPILLYDALDLVEFKALITEIRRYNYPGVTNNIMIGLETYTALAAHPNIVGCKMSHGNVSHHLQVSLDPAIDHSNFRVFSGFGQQLGPIVLFGAAGVIDGLAAIYPATVARLFELSAKRPVEPEALKEIQKLQFVVSRAEEKLGKWGIVGIKEGIYRVLNFGNMEGGRLPLKGSLPEGEWSSWNVAMDSMMEIEKTLQQ